MIENTDHIVNGPRAWGRGDYETKALQRMAENWHGDVPDGSFEIQLVRVRGFEAIERASPTSIRVDAEEVLGREELEIDSDLFEQFVEHVDEIDLLAEGVLLSDAGGSD